MARPTVDRALVRRVAELAALSFTDEEADRLAGELGKILDHVALLDELDTTGVPPTAQLPAERPPLRDDEVRPGLDHAAALDQAPRVQDDGFAVPAFVGEK